MSLEALIQAVRREEKARDAWLVTILALASEIYKQRLGKLAFLLDEEEQKLRLRLLKKLPASLLMAEEALNKAGLAYDKAEKAFTKAEETEEAEEKAETFNKAREAYKKVWEARNKELETYLRE